MRLPDFLPPGGISLGSWSPRSVDEILAPAGDARCHNACAAGFGIARGQCSASFDAWRCMAALDAGSGVCNSLC
jgi:hypothetical protein